MSPELREVHRFEERAFPRSPPDLSRCGALTTPPCLCHPGSPGRWGGTATSPAVASPRGPRPERPKAAASARPRGPVLTLPELRCVLPRRPHGDSATWDFFKSDSQRPRHHGLVAAQDGALSCGLRGRACAQRLPRSHLTSRWSRVASSQAHLKKSAAGWQFMPSVARPTGWRFSHWGRFPP